MKGTGWFKDVVLLVCLILLPASAMGLYASNREDLSLTLTLSGLEYMRIICLP